MVIQNTLEFCIMHYLKILFTKHLLIPYGLNELKYKRIPKDKTPLNLLCWGGGDGEENESMYDKLA